MDDTDPLSVFCEAARRKHFITSFSSFAAEAACILVSVKLWASLDVSWNSENRQWQFRGSFKNIACHFVNRIRMILRKQNNEYTIAQHDVYQLNCLRFLGGLSLHLNHLIAEWVSAPYWQFGTLPVGIFLSNLVSGQLETSLMTSYCHFWNLSTFGDSRAVWVFWPKLGVFRKSKFSWWRSDGASMRLGGFR